VSRHDVSTITNPTSSMWSARHAWPCLPRVRFRISALLVFVMLFAASGLARAQAGANQHPADLSDQINKLARQLYGEPYYAAGAVPGEIQKLVLGSLSGWLAQNAALQARSTYPLDVRVRMQLEDYFLRLRYPWFARPVTFVRPWKGEQLIGAGYTLGWSDFDRVNCVAVFEREASRTNLAAVTNFVPQADLNYAFLPDSSSGDFRFIVYGYILGKSQPRLSAIAYSFDGKRLKDLWEKKDVYDGKITVTPQSVTIRYLVEDEYVQATQQNQLPPGHEAIYRVTPQGLALETDHNIPYRDMVLR
jgi:hypothetical protein